MTIFLLFLHLCFTTEFYQLLKIPVFVAHYFERKEANNNLSLGQFIFIHYGQGDVHDEDYDRDMQLPFKTDNCLAHGIQISVPETTPVVTKPPAADVVRRYLMLPTTSVLHFYTSSIWQPPKYS
jgi:hypothetical protein